MKACKIIERFPVPTGDILIVQGERGKLEMLSIGDYGKDVNLKADCLGLSRTPDPVRHTKMLPLQEKWVVTISTQYGCSMECSFCDVPKVGPGLNATEADLIGQVLTAIELHPEVESTDRLNIHFARMGEPTWNPAVLDSTLWLKLNLDSKYKIHPVVSTMLPKDNRYLGEFIFKWVQIKNHIIKGEAGLQLSINSTSERERLEMFGGCACTLEEIASIMYGLTPVGRKFTLNFAVADYEIDPSVLLKYFDPSHYIVKLTPMHKTSRCVESGVKTDGDYTTYAPYEHYETSLKSAGYDVLVFIASREEDEGRITCGNAILSGTRPFDIPTQA
jgi:23S rRNA (adenine2503-C2)-methyltransferase